MKNPEITPQHQFERENAPPATFELGRIALGDASEAGMPEGLEDILSELVKDRLIARPPVLAEDQWRRIDEIAKSFSSGAPNAPARRVRRKLAVYQLLNEAPIDEESGGQRAFA